MCGGQLRQSNDLPKRKEVTGGGGWMALVPPIESG
jgi:hypothetical protein